MTRSPLLGALLVVGACAHSASELRRQDASLARAVRRGDLEAVHSVVLASALPMLDRPRLTDPQSRRVWGKRLGRVDDIHLGASVFLGPEQPTQVVKQGRRWAFASDPTEVYGQSTPEQAVAALVLASRRSRWDVLLRLAPRRYREGLSTERLEAAWTEGESGAALRRARDRVAEHLGDPIAHDDHEAKLDLGQGQVVRLEREAGAWVIVDF